MNDLIMQLALFQVAVPLALILLNGVIPMGSRAGWLLRTVAILLGLAYALVAGIWLFPPWWTPLLLALLHLWIAGRQYRRLMARGPVQLSWQTLEAGLAVLLAMVFAYMLVPALQGRTAPKVAIDLSMPLGPGRYLVLSGGATPAINAHFETLNRPSAAAFRGQSRAVDIIGINALGVRAPGISPADPRVYRIYGADVLAPCAGRVVEAVDGVADNPVPQMNRAVMTGNSVLLECQGLAVLLAHFAPGSLRVEEGDSVTAGQVIGQVGNSGNSGEPHLHLHVQTLVNAGAPLSGKPLWFTVDGAFLVRNMRFVVP
ncbi:M23 family metallopeptidase [Sulfitobacter sp. JB4-11]|uniref:M23 family metallopeptidase n=1 Tax=Sulfitobacter rhodophyticola TaxID=3238304 RepID=UPI00351915FE